MTFTAVVTGHARERELRRMLGCLMYQTRKPDETLVYLSGIDAGAVARLREDFPWAAFHVEPDLGDWGHDKRAKGLAAATGDAVGWFNDDDDYTSDYIERMVARLEDGADIAYCNWSYSPTGCTFQSHVSTSGNFVVRTPLAREVGWNGRGYTADGEFIAALASRTGAIVKIEDVLYQHNPGQ